MVLERTAFCGCAFFPAFFGLLNPLSLGETLELYSSLSVSNIERSIKKVCSCSGWTLACRSSKVVFGAKAGTDSIRRASDANDGNCAWPTVLQNETTSLKEILILL